ncbi:uncharacterized protein PHACADRAFT_105655, partial [Phanerochaete carnosa HHB-10118-sp]
FTWELAVRKGHVLEAHHGAVRHHRHPSYDGAPVRYVGVVCTIFGRRSAFGWNTTVGWVFTAVCIGWATGIPMLLMGKVGREGEVLRQEFGAQWEAYAKRVPDKLCPFIF